MFSKLPAVLISIFFLWNGVSLIASPPEFRDETGTLPSLQFIATHNDTSLIVEFLKTQNSHGPSTSAPSGSVTLINNSRFFEVDEKNQNLEIGNLRERLFRSPPSITLAQNAANEPATVDEKTTSAPADNASNSAAKPASATSILKQSRKDLNSLKSIRASLDETVSFGTKRFQAVGTYVQGTELKLKLEYAIKLGGSKGTLIEVCDGQVLWTQQTIDKDVQLTRRDVRQILEVAKSLPRKDSIMLHTELGLGGLPALLASLEQSMTFKLGAEETLENHHLIVLEGRWNKEYQQLWTGGSKDPKAVLLPYIPDRVRIYMEHVPHQERMIHFPARIIYLKKTDPEKATFRPLVTLQFNDIVLDGAVRDDEFQFEPAEGVIPEDVTQAYIQQLKPQQPSASPASATPAKEPKVP